MKVQERALSWSIKRLIAHVQRRTMNRSTYAGIKCVKSPTDWWVYQELLWEIRPEVVVEIGNLAGGSALALAHLLDAIGEGGGVIGVDRDHSLLDPRAAHSRIRWVEGDAKAADVVAEVRRLIEGASPVLIIDDSAHTYRHTLAVLRAYADLVTPGSYFVVEDGICWHGLDHGPRPGPFEACRDFVREDPRFEADRSRESFLLTWNPGGYLRRVT